MRPGHTILREVTHAEDSFRNEHRIPGERCGQKVMSVSATRQRGPRRRSRRDGGSHLRRFPLRRVQVRIGTPGDGRRFAQRSAIVSRADGVEELIAEREPLLFRPRAECEKTR